MDLPENRDSPKPSSPVRGRPWYGGETVLMLIPPELWVIIDSFKCGRPSRPAAESIVSRYGGKVVLVVLTHPHQDHYPGFVDLIDRYSEAVLGCVQPQDDSGMTNALPVDATSQALKAVREGHLYANLGRMDDGAEHEGGIRFVVRRAFVGQATITSLHPVRPVPGARHSGRRHKRNLIGHVG